MCRHLAFVVISENVTFPSDMATTSLVPISTVERPLPGTHRGVYSLVAATVLPKERKEFPCESYSP